MEQSNIEIGDNAENVWYVIQEIIHEYQNKLDKDSHVVLYFANFGKETAMLLQKCWYTGNEIIEFSGVDFFSGKTMQIIQNFREINYQLTFVESGFSNESLSVPLTPAQFIHPTSIKN